MGYIEQKSLENVTALESVKSRRSIQEVLTFFKLLLIQKCGPVATRMGFSVETPTNTHSYLHKGYFKMESVVAEKALDLLNSEETKVGQVRIEQVRPDHLVIRFQSAPYSTTINWGYYDTSKQPGQIATSMTSLSCQKNGVGFSFSPDLTKLYIHSAGDTKLAATFHPNKINQE